jgi:hypothetical protein
MEQRRFREDLSEYLRKLVQYKQARAHHDQIRDLFVTFLRKAFPGLELEDDIELEVVKWRGSRRRAVILWRTRRLSSM